MFVSTEQLALSSAMKSILNNKKWKSLNLLTSQMTQI